jgi:RHS repeat-associated protein
MRVYDIHFIYYGSPPPKVLDQMTYSKICDAKNDSGDPRECDVSYASDTQGYEGDPINTRNGSFNYSVVDLSLQTIAGPLTFQRSYASGATSLYTGGSGLGYGWTHNQLIKLIFDTDAVQFKAHTANLYKFYDNGNHVYTPYPGVTAQLTYNSGSLTYTLVASNQSVYTFDSSGKLLTWRNALGQGFDYTYTGDRIDLVTELLSGKFLQFNYSGDRLASVSDNAGRFVFYDRDANIDLTSFTDAMGNTWTYVYDSSHHLRLVKDPQNQAVVHTEYNAQGRAYRQYDDESLDRLSLELGYGANGVTNISEFMDGKVITRTHKYDAWNTLAEQVNAKGKITKTIYGNFRPNKITDPLSHNTQLTWSSNSFNLTKRVDASGASTDMTYDSLNNLTSLKDGLGYTTVYTYSGTLLRSSTNAELETTVYTYTTSADAPQPVGMLKAVEDPNHNLTHYAYNAFGERISMTDALDRVTYYQNNDLGLLEKVTTPDSQSDWTCYDAMGRTVRRVVNASGDGSTPQTDPCDVEHYLPSTNPTYDRISSTVYDTVGNAIATIDHDGRITRTYYDGRSRPLRVVRNLSEWQIQNPEPPPSSLFTNQANLTSETVYDLSGRLIASHEWLVEGSQVISRSTRTYYDLLGRPEYVTQNFVGDLYASTPPTYDPNFPDRNVTTRTYYDAVGNHIAVKDPLDRITRTYYDVLDRPYLMAHSWSGSDIYSSTPPTCNRGEGAETNVCSETFYDAAGNAIASRDARGTVTRTYYDKVKRPMLTVQHLTSQAYTMSAPPASSTFGNDHDVATGTVYDDGGRTIASVEWLVQGGQVISHTNRAYYDPLNRSYLVVQNLDPAHDMYNPAPPTCNRDATGLVEPHNVCRQTIYHPQSGNTIADIDPLGRVSRAYYDNLDRPVMQVRNLTSQPYVLETPPPSSSFGNDHDVASSVQYDDLGNAIASAEWLVESGQPVSRTVRTFYDQLDRPVSVVRNFVGGLFDPQPPAFDPNYPDRNLRLDTAYASDGNSLASIEWLANEVAQPVARTTRAYYDGLGREIQVVQNLDPAWDWANPSPPACNRDSTGTQGTHNVCQETFYDAGGEMVSSKDALGRVTGYTYDLLGRLKIVTDPSSYQTAYVYDANGYRVKITDAEGVTTRYEYDELDRLDAVVENYLPGVDPDHQTNVRTEYSYDARGNQLSILDGNGHTTSFLFDALGRKVSETDAVNNQWTMRYDVAGNRVGLLDANQAATVYGYDGLYRLNSIDYPAPDPDVAFETNALGWRTIMTDGLGVTTWQFDNLGRILTITHPISGTVGYRYDAQGNRTRLIYLDGKNVTYTYDLLDRLVGVEDWASQVITYTYDPLGQLLTILRPNDVDSYYSYDDTGRLISIEHNGEEGVLTSFQYQYDAIGNRTQALEHLAGGAASPTLMITVADTTGAPLANKTVYAFDGATYTGYNKVTDALGQASITLPGGSYRFRVDVDGTQFWSGEANHCTIGACSNVFITVTQPVLVSVQDSDGASKEGLSVYAFDGSTYTGYNGVTDVNGQVSLRLPQGNYRFRTDFNGTQFWSDSTNHCSVPQCTLVELQVTVPVIVTVEDDIGTPKLGISVYAFDDSMYTNFSATTDINGRASFTLPQGNYRFRADFNGTQFWSGSSNHCTVPDCTAATITVTLSTQVTVLDTDGSPKAGLWVYVFDGATYKNFNGTTNANGQVVFTLPQGSYRFRADLNGTQFWSGTGNHCTVPGCDNVSVTVTKPVTVTVLDTDNAPKSGLNVYAFNGSTYTNFSKTTNLNGQAVFTLPQGSYRFRADLNGTQFWSGTSNHCSLPGCESTGVVVTIPLVVTVTDGGGTAMSGVKVYAFNGTTYTNFSGTTGASGEATFTLPQGSYRFRADYDGSQYWSGETNHCDVPGCLALTLVVGPQSTPTPTSTPEATPTSTGYLPVYGKALAMLWISSDAQLKLAEPFVANMAQQSQTDWLTVTVQDTDGVVRAGLNVYAFDGATYSGFSGVSDDAGRALLSLPQGSYRFRADFNGTQFWSSASNHCTVPGCDKATITVTKPVTVTVHDTDGAAQAGLNLYAFDGTTYTNYHAASDLDGQAVLTLLEGAYRFRADLNGVQFWSGIDNHCAIPGCTSTEVVVTSPVTLTVLDTDGVAQTGLNVYAFDGDSYTNYHAVTVADGTAMFTLPQGAYRFRADLNGTQFWSGAENHCTLPGCRTATITVTKPVVVSVKSQTSLPYPNLPVYVFSAGAYTGYNGVTDLNGNVTLTLPQGAYRFRADYDGVQFWSGSEEACQVPGCLSAAVTLPGGKGQTSLTIDYQYDALGRLVSAIYSDGTAFSYTYDAVGNRLTQQSLAGTNTYIYDAANRLSSVDGITYTWDANGNLLSDGVNTYAYDKANRLKSFTGVSLSASYAYNGLGDRMQQTVNGVPETYLLDTATGLTQVLADGAHTYLYGVDRISQQCITVTDYFLGDALGSVRQLTDASGSVTLAKSYDPYGEVLAEVGSGATSFGYTGEWTDATGLVNLRARYYVPGQGRFLTKDVWEGNYEQPMSFNAWLYAYANPINWTDPTGHIGFYNRSVAVRYAYEHDLDAPVENGIHEWSREEGGDCTSFVSLALWAGGVRDTRRDPFKKSDYASDYKGLGFGYWHKKKTLTEKLVFDSYNRLSWNNVDGLFIFLTKVLHFRSYDKVGDIPWFHKGVTSKPDQKAWLDFLNNTPIEPGDVVQYNDGSGWVHSALIVEIDKPQTFFEKDAGTTNYLPNNGCVFPNKPRIVDRNGPIDYVDSRSIDNTGVMLSEIRIIHVPDILPLSIWVHYVH